MSRRKPGVRARTATFASPTVPTGTIRSESGSFPECIEAWNRRSKSNPSLGNQSAPSLMWVTVVETSIGVVPFPTTASASFSGCMKADWLNPVLGSFPFPLLKVGSYFLRHAA